MFPLTHNYEYHLLASFKPKKRNKRKKYEILKA